MKVKITEVKNYIESKGDELDCEDHKYTHQEIENGFDYHNTCSFCGHRLTPDEKNNRDN